MNLTFETPVGTFDTFKLAAAACERADLDPCECVRAVHIIQPGDWVKCSYRPDLVGALLTADDVRVQPHHGAGMVPILWSTGEISWELETSLTAI